MFIFIGGGAIPMIDVYVAVTKTGVAKKLPKQWTSILVIFLSVCFSLSGTIHAATRQDLLDQIADLNIKLADLQAKSSALSQDQAKLIGRYQLTNAPKSALFIVGTSTSTKGQTLQIPISFIPSSSTIVSLQQDMVIPSSFTLVSVAAGPAATTAQKSVQVNIVNGIARLLVFGLNQTPIGEGILVIATVKSVATVPSGVYSIGAISPVASDANGGTVPLSVTSGWVKIQ